MTQKSPSLTVLDPEHVQLTLDTKQAFAVWRALECYAEISVFAQQQFREQLGQRTIPGVKGLEATLEVRDLIGAHMRQVLGYPEGSE